jgi:benzoyl-CoA 2,3-dioxygenase component B
MTMDLINVSYDSQIPNNVGLSSDKKVLKALEKWHPGYINWWNDLIPQNFQESMVYLRTAVSVDPKGWAKFDYVKMPEYRWGVLLAPAVEGRTSLAGSAGRISQHAKTYDRHSGRHRAGISRTTTLPWSDSTIAL